MKINKYLLLILTITCITTINAQEKENKTSTNQKSDCISGDCENGYGKIKYNNGTYEGNFKNGIKHGKGFYKWNSKDSYEGDFKDGKKDGHGVYHYSDGWKHIGEFIDGKLTGKAKQYNEKGKLVFEGYFVKGKLHGYGTSHFNNGGKYVGEYSNGKRHGYGKEINKNGDVAYEGQWENGKTKSNVGNKTPDTNIAKTKGCISGNCTDGYGKYVYDNGYYKGFFKDGKKNDYGFYSWNNGDFYFGNWNDNSRNGYGEYFWKNGSDYIGEWKNGAITGYGIKKESDKTYKRGIWNNNVLKVKYNFYSNSTSKGCTIGNCNNGYGKYVWKNGDSYTGFFVNNKRIMGNYQYASGIIYQGQFATDGSFSGNGYYLWENSSYYRGGFKNYKRSGLGYYKNKKDNSEMIGVWEKGELIKNYK
jgi:hypothetical protein